MGLWSEIDRKLYEGEELIPDEELALIGWLRSVKSADAGIRLLKELYPKSIELIRKLEGRLLWRI